ncbi:O-antigen translocase, partial [Aegicerativicinus sediminis]
NTKLISTSFLSVIVISVLLGIVLSFYSSDLSAYLFSGNTVFSYVLIIFGVTLPFLSLNTLFMASLNGRSEFKKLLQIQIAGQILAATITIVLIWNYLLKGALIAVVLSEVALLFILLFYRPIIKPILSQLSKKSFCKTYLFKLGGYSIMALVSAILLPLVYIIIRNYIISNLGSAEAGYWEGMNRLSRYYLMFISTLLTLYILPKFSGAEDSLVFRKEVFNFYKSILPWFGIGLIVIYFLREQIIKLVFTEEFLPMKNLFLFQLLGDLVKVMALVISYQFLAKKMIFSYVITELISVGLFYLLSMYFIRIYGIQGVVIGYFLNYCFYFLILLYMFRKPLILKQV